jgi:hypothetical protein
MGRVVRYDDSLRDQSLLGFIFDCGGVIASMISETTFIVHLQDITEVLCPL